MCRANEIVSSEDNVYIGIFVRMIVASIAVLLLFASGCMTVTITDSMLVNSGVNQDKPIRAGISTTGEAIGEAIKAAGWGGPVDVEALKGIIEEWRKLRRQNAIVTP